MPFREDLKPDRLLALEEEVLRRWETERTFEETLEARKGAREWVFYDGPPTANGKPGIHHVLSRTLKDFACRLKTMQGFLVPRKAGWDTHGLPVEIETERTLGIQGKQQIEALGIAKFNEACRKSVFRYLEDWKRLTTRMGYWVDLDRAYITCSPEYVESMWWILAQFHRKGVLYRGHKVLPYCPRCATPLSSHEVGLGFKDVQDPSVFVRFPLEDGSGALLVWTTTPWTLPANVAVAANPAIDYVQVETLEGPSAGERLWLAAARAEALKAKHRVVATVKGSDLAGRRYRRPVAWYAAAPSEKAFTVLPADFVSTEDGTGLVHVAPAYGEDDFQLGRREGLPVLHPVDGQGRFREGAPVSGKFVKEADKDVIAFLKSEGLLFRRETVDHAYPHCWRCESPLLYYARDSWYLRTTRFKERMIELNARIRWYPESVGRGRFGQWLENNVDWAISRDRYWGTPLPVWVCDACKAERAVESLVELETLGGRRVEDPHRPWVDEPTWACAKDGCRGTMRRTPEVVDCWFDSGSMPFGQWHYPFENRETAERSHPAEFIAEGVDQTRGWFYTLLAVSTMLKDETAFRACASNDMILDAQGKKMSKSRGNVVDPIAMMDKYGADVVRWHLIVRPWFVPFRYQERELVEIRNRVFGTLLNVYAFFATYANADGYTGAERPPASRPPFDRWLLSRLGGLVAEVGEAFESYDTARAGERIAAFVVDDLSTWYVRRNRARCWASGWTDDKASAYDALRTTLATLARLLAPITPFVAESLHRALGEGPRSVHAAAWPRSADLPRDPELEEGMDTIRRIVSIGHAARKGASLRTRQPLAAAVVDAPGLSPAARAFAAEERAVIEDELNVKSATVAAAPETRPGDWAASTDRGITVSLDTRVTPELEAEGIAREVSRALNGMRKKAGLKVDDRVHVRWHADAKGAAALRTWAGWISAEVLAVSFEEASSRDGLADLEVPGCEIGASVARAT